jgi:hypothetical protein
MYIWMSLKREKAKSKLAYGEALSRNIELE